MRLGICQINIEWEEKKVNQKNINYFVQEASKQRIDLVLFPEMCLTGFSMNILITLDRFSETIDYFKTLTKKHSINIGFGWTKNSSSSEHGSEANIAPKIKAENHYTVITPSGEIISDYTKIHPFSYANEDQFFQGGEQISHFHVNDFTASTFICYDLRFPEIFQAASIESHLIIVAANWPEARREHWRCLMRARAIENQVYMVGVNCVGEIGSTKYAGDSCIIDPQGNVLAELSYQEGLLVYDINNDVAQYRKEFPVKQDRKLEIYKKYY